MITNELAIKINELIMFLEKYSCIFTLTLFVQLIANFLIIFSIRKNTKDIKKIIERFYLTEHYDQEYIEDRKASNDFKFAIVVGGTIIILVLIFFIL